MPEILYETDIGDHVECDVCSTDYTDSDESGGFLFGSYAYCPVCAKERYDNIKSNGEEHFIKAFCPPSKSFKQFVLDARGGNNKVTISKW